MSTSTCTRCGVRFQPETNETVCPFCMADQAPDSSLGADLARGFTFGAVAMVLTALVWYWMTTTMDHFTLSVLFAGLIGILIPTAIAYGSLRKPSLMTQGIALVQILLAMIYSPYWALRTMAGPAGSQLPALSSPVRAVELLLSLVEEKFMPVTFWTVALGFWLAFPLFVKHDKSGYLGVLARRLR